MHTQNRAGCFNYNGTGVEHTCSIYTVFLSEMASSSSESSRPSSLILIISLNVKVKLKLVDIKYQADIASTTLCAVIR